MCNVKDVARTNNPTSKYYPILQFFAAFFFYQFTNFTVFLFAVLILWPTTLQFWFFLNTLINLVSSRSRQVIVLFLLIFFL